MLRRSLESPGKGHKRRYRGRNQGVAYVYVAAAALYPRRLRHLSDDSGNRHQPYIGEPAVADRGPLCRPGELSGRVRIARTLAQHRRHRAVHRSRNRGCLVGRPRLCAPAGPVAHGARDVASPAGSALGDPVPGCRAALRSYLRTAHGGAELRPQGDRPASGRVAHEQHRGVLERMRPDGLGALPVCDARVRCCAAGGSVRPV